MMQNPHAHSNHKLSPLETWEAKMQVIATSNRAMPSKISGSQRLRNGSKLGRIHAATASLIAWLL
jgi:hypothetical protein